MARKAKAKGYVAGGVVRAMGSARQKQADLDALSAARSETARQDALDADEGKAKGGKVRKVMRRGKKS